MHSRLGALILVGVLGLSACTTEYHHSNDPEIRFAETKDRYEDVALHKVYHDGALVGWVDTKRLIDGDSNDYNDRYDFFVLDTDRNALGYVSDRGEAYRFQAHSEPLKVGLHDDLARNVNAVFGFNTGETRLEKQ